MYACVWGSCQRCVGWCKHVTSCLAARATGRSLWLGTPPSSPPPRPLSRTMSRTLPMPQPRSSAAAGGAGSLAASCSATTAVMWSSRDHLGGGVGGVDRGTGGRRRGEPIGGVRAHGQGGEGREGRRRRGASPVHAGVCARAPQNPGTCRSLPVAVAELEDAPVACQVGQRLARAGGQVGGCTGLRPEGGRPWRDPAFRPRVACLLLRRARRVLAAHARAGAGGVERRGWRRCGLEGGGAACGGAQTRRACGSSRGVTAYTPSTLAGPQCRRHCDRQTQATTQIECAAFESVAWRLSVRARAACRQH